jgi:hypothetical protein
MYNTRKKSRKNHRVTKRKFITHLKSLYPSCKFDKNINYNIYNNHKITYGEMEYEGMEELYNYIKKKYNSYLDTFIDVGSGRGKLCMFMAAQKNIDKSVGIELVKERYEDALLLQKELIEYQDTGKTTQRTHRELCRGGSGGEKIDYAKKVTLINQNILDIDFENYISPDSNVFVWFSNLCFEQNTTNEIFQKINEELPNNSIVCCSKMPNPTVGIFLGKIQIPMSWSKNSEVYIYKTEHC